MASWRSPLDHSGAQHVQEETNNDFARANADPRSDAPWPYHAHHDQHEYQRPTTFSSTPDPEPDPGPAYHPVIDASIFSCSSASHLSSTNAGRFVHAQCDQELFNAEYLRSNKASGHKNLRCFPHCCGGHNPKSFCGSGLVVECAVPTAQIALGRFEELVKSPHSTTNANVNSSDDTNNAIFQQHQNPPSTNQVQHERTHNASDRVILPGESYAQHDLFRELKSSENPFGMWFKGTAVASRASDSVAAAAAPPQPRFHLNGNRASWHYGWQSSRLNCKHLHVFRVFFFTQDNTDNDTLQCVGSVASPPFRISSSRKARKTFRTSPSMHSLADSVSDDQRSLPQSSPRAMTGEEDESLGLDKYPITTTTTPLPTLRSQSSFDLGLGVGGGSGFGLPSLSSRLSRAATATTTTTSAMAITMPQDPFHATRPYQYPYRGQPDRKRLTRSASLQTDYYSSSPISLTTTSLTRQPRARTFPSEDAAALVSIVTPAPSGPTVRPFRGGMMSMDSLLNASPDVRTTVPAIAAPPPLTLSHVHLSPSVTTPVADMMHLQIGTPRATFVRSSSDFVTPLSDVVSLRPPPLSAELSGRPRRKRTRSVDSGHASTNQCTPDDAWYSGPLLQEIAPDGDWDLVTQAHALGVVIAVVSRLQPVHTEDPTLISAYRVIMDNSLSSDVAPGLASVCAVLLHAVARLVHHSRFLADMRATMHTRLQDQDPPNQPPQQQRPQTHDDPGRCKRLLELYETMLTIVLPHVEAQLSFALSVSTPQPQEALPLTPTSSPSPSPLIEWIRMAEHALVASPWWRDISLFDDDDDEYPFLASFERYYNAVRASIANAPPPLSTDRLSNPSTLSGDWRLVNASLDNQEMSQAWVARGWPSTPTPWLQQQLVLYESQTFRLVETATQVSLTLGHSLVSPVCPFIAELDHHPPVVFVPPVPLPFVPTPHSQLLAAHRAWREASGLIAVRTMQWPSHRDCRLVGDEDLTKTTSCRALLRTRCTVYFAMASTARLDVRVVVEGCVTEDATLCALAFAPPTDAGMAAYFETPAAWATLAQSSFTYARV